MRLSKSLMERLMVKSLPQKIWLQVDEDWLWAMQQQEMEWTGENVDCPGLGQV